MSPSVVEREVGRRAYAKVNLSLSVGPPIAPGLPNAGYHPISSWFAAVSLWDDVSIERLGVEAASEYDIAWAPDAPKATAIDWPIEKDLGVRSHRLIEETVGRTLPVRIRVRKRIPVGGGLGGGSSDAAAVLVGVRDAFGLNLPTRVLIEMSKRLGSDIAFFLDEEEAGDSGAAKGMNRPPRPAIVSGQGDRIERKKPLEWPILLVVPPFGCPTGSVYKAYDCAPVELRDNEIRRVCAEAERCGAIDACAMFNDLTKPACEVETRLRGVMESIDRVAELTVSMSGSGSTLFVLGETREDEARLVRLRDMIQRECRGVVGVVTSVL